MDNHVTTRNRKMIENAEIYNDYFSDYSDACKYSSSAGNDSNLLIVFYVQIMPDDFVMQLHRF